MVSRVDLGSAFMCWMSSLPGSITIEHVTPPVHMLKLSMTDKIYLFINPNVGLGCLEHMQVKVKNKSDAHSA